MESTLRQPSRARSLVDVPLHDIGIYCSLTVFLVALFFSDILPSSGVLRVASAWSCLGFAFLRTVYDRSGVRIASTFWIWTLFLIYILMNKGSGLFSGSGLRWLLTFTPLLFAFLFLRDDCERWLLFVVKVIAVLATVHAIATVVFFIVPSLYSGFFYPKFMGSRYINRMGYKAALTGHYSTNGMYLAHGLIATWSLIQLEDKSKQRWTVLFAIILFALLLTTKRAHLVFGLASCSLVYLAVRPGESFGRVTRLILMAVGLATVVLALSQIIPELLDVLDRLKIVTDDDTFGGRADYYRICVDMWRRSPVFGLGWATFPQERLASGLAKVQRAMRLGAGLIQNAHNVYLQVLAEEGAIGLFLFLWAAYSSLMGTLFLIRRGDSSAVMRVLYAWALGAQAFFLMYCLTGNPLYDVYEYAPYLAACSVAFTRDLPSASADVHVGRLRTIR